MDEPRAADDDGDSDDRLAREVRRQLDVELGPLRAAARELVSQIHESIKDRRRGPDSLRRFD